MSIQKALDFNNGYGNYSGDAKPTTQADMYRFMANQNNVLMALTNAILWQPGTAYQLGDVVCAPAMNGYRARCTVAGTSGSDEPNWNLGGGTTDGSVEWTLEQQSAINEQQSAATAAVSNNLATKTNALDAKIDDEVAKLTASMKILPACLPGAYHRNTLATSAKTTITIPTTYVNIGDYGYVQNGDNTINLATAASWDASTYATAANRAGKDFYIYAVQPSSGTVPKIILSANSTVPTGYTASNSRKIGGFHCLCADVGTISGHTLSGYVKGNILPASVWDLYHRPVSSPEGMVWSGRKWYDIYLASWNGSKLVSAYGATIADGSSSKSFTGEMFEEEFARAGKMLISREDFKDCAYGSNEGTNIYGSSDPGTTGGHKDTASRRMISNIGCEDCCGALWQWTRDWWENSPAIKTGTTLNGAPAYNSDNYKTKTENRWLHDIGYGTWSDFSVTDTDTDIENTARGQTWGIIIRALVGGHWGRGSRCGSRSAILANLSSGRYADCAGRGASELRVATL